METKNLRIYLQKEKNSFVGVDLDNKKVSTRSGYPDSFFDKLNENRYRMFEYEEVNVFKVNEKEIIFLDIFDNKDQYKYIGNAKNKEELLLLLKNIKSVVLINFSKEGFLTCTRRNSENFCFPGGKIEENETPEEAIIRETKEETGIDLLKENIHLVNTDYINGYYCYVFVSFLENLVPYQNEEGIIPSFREKEVLLSDKAEFKEFNQSFFNSVKEITTWYRYNKKNDNYEYNHFEEDVSENLKPKPIKEDFKNQKEWKNLGWDKKIGYLIYNKVFEL